ncbi:MAG: phosphoglucosamine mutase [Saprospiraceae bacterium]|nr:phosphoglucosamine mutase [Saprospiraceae bacterium]MBK7736682.1 phosphoglucosamine mutase [Saprospiraceae bacterium]MBK7911955.1 phosphoglucosamine mutase [Saprospiraceae bacterium]
MSLITSISGIRGTIGGFPGDNLSPLDLLKFTTAYVRLLQLKTERPRVVIGRDGRMSGEVLSQFVCSSLQFMGVDVIQTGLSTTPSVEMAVPYHKADGGIILTASHNPKNWNALKLLNASGEFISSEEGIQILNWSQDTKFDYAEVDKLGRLETDHQSIQRHVDAILNLPFIPVESIRSRNFKIVADCINSTAAMALPVLFDALNIEYHLINKEITGEFVHNPEPLPQHLTELMQVTGSQQFDLGIAVDPDVDRLALVDENGHYFGEEYTLVTAADYMMQIKPGNVVSNLSSSRALGDLCKIKGGGYFASPVGEVHVVKKMKETNACIGGEGNGGIILPDLHYGRDSLVGIALILSNMILQNKSLSQLRKSYPSYFMHKDKIELNADLNYLELLTYLKKEFQNEQLNFEDGMKIDFDNSWIHLRKSNTEPIIRIYTEAKTMMEAENLANSIKLKIAKF